MGDVRERPILFSAPMIRALLAGTKTQTRRVVKIGNSGQAVDFVGGRGQEDDPSCWGFADQHGDYYTLANEDPRLRVRCPYGQPGDRLWVRETTRSRFLPNMITGEPTNALCGEYIADGEPVLDEHEFDFAWWYSRPVCPSIFMPRWASRLTLEVTRVRVERVQEISEEDARAEGVDPADHHPTRPYAQAYSALWNAINGKRAPWESNPWVWVIEFKKVEVANG